MTSIALVASGMVMRLRRHWYVSRVPPVTVTFNESVASSKSVWLWGDDVITGGATMPDPLGPPGVGVAATQFCGSLPYWLRVRRCRESPPPSTAPAGHGGESE